MMRRGWVTSSSSMPKYVGPDNHSSLCSTHMAVTVRRHASRFGKTRTTRIRRFRSQSKRSRPFVEWMPPAGPRERAARQRGLDSGLKPLPHCRIRSAPGLHLIHAIVRPLLLQPLETARVRALRDRSRLAQLPSRHLWGNTRSDCHAGVGLRPFGWTRCEPALSSTGVGSHIGLSTRIRPRPPSASRASAAG